MRSEGEKYDPCTVIGLNTRDAVLVVGNPAYMPWLKEATKEEYVISARKASEIEYLIREGVTFMKMIIGRETPFSNDHILRAGILLKECAGLLVYFPQDEGQAWQFKTSLEFYYPTARVWESDSTFGRVIMAEPYGASIRLTA